LLSQATPSREQVAPTNNGSGDSGFVSLSVALAIKKLTGVEIEKMLPSPTSISPTFPNAGIIWPKDPIDQSALDV
jgi:hypothetical protein